MSKRTKASKKRLNNLLIILLLTAVLLVMSTYAWFTANRTVKIDSLQVYVEATSGLLISANGEDWKTILTADDIKHAADDSRSDTYAWGGYTTTNLVNQIPANMKPVSTDGTLWNSTADGHKAGQLKMFLGQTSTDLDDTSPTYGHYLLEAIAQADRSVDIRHPETAENTGNYIAFDVFLRYDQEGTNADHSTPLYSYGSVTEYVADGEDPTNKQLENAARVAIIKGENTTSSTVPASVRALNTLSGSEVVLWEPNYDSHSQRSVENAANYGITTLNASSGNPWVAYAGIKAAYTLATYSTKVELYQANATNHSDYFANVNPAWKSTTGDTTHFAMPSGIPKGATKYRIYMWIEGQDVDCQNYASGQSIEYKLNFTLDES